GLPVIALNVERVNVEFFRIKPEALPKFLARWGRSSNLDTWEARQLLPMAELVYGGRFDLKPARNTRETLLLPIAGLEPFKQPARRPRLGRGRAAGRRRAGETRSRPVRRPPRRPLGVPRHGARPRGQAAGGLGAAACRRGSMALNFPETEAGHDHNALLLYLN